MKRSGLFSAVMLSLPLLGCEDDPDVTGGSDEPVSEAGTSGSKAGAGGSKAGAGGSAEAGKGGSGGSAGGESATIDFAKFDSALEAAIEEYNASEGAKELPLKGASAIVVTKRDGLVHSKGYGDFAVDRSYLIASASKILSVGVVMRLADEGKLDINEPISTYLGDGWGEHKTNVTFAQLVSNSSGLPSLEEILGASTSADGLEKYGAHFCQYSPEGSLADCGKGIYTDAQPDNNREPDQTFRYGGSQWQLAGALAEVVSGKSWAELIQETYVDPCDVPTLGFTNPFGASSSGDSAPFAYPAFFKGDAANAIDTENPSIEGGAYVTGPDYAKLLHMHLNDGKCGDNQVLSAEAVKTMRTDRVAAYGGTVALGESAFSGYGLGWWIADDHIADPGAYGAYPFLDLEREYGAMILLEVSSTVGGEIAQKIKPTLDELFDGASN